MSARAAAIAARDLVAAYSSLARGQSSAAVRKTLMPNLTPDVNVYDHGNFHVCTFNCLQDNIGFMIRPTNGNVTIAVDIPEAKRYIEVAKQLNWWPVTHALLTHHHWDHAGGIPELVQHQPDLKLYGGEIEKKNLLKYTSQEPCNGNHDKYWVSPFLNPEDVVSIGGLDFRVYHVPGHTNGHIAFHMEAQQTIFTGDVLFAMGCGRAFEGTPAQLCGAFETFHEKCGPETVVYCAHEYTVKNGEFACAMMNVEDVNAVNGSAESEQAILAERCTLIADYRKQGFPTVPTVMELEFKTNPFYVIPFFNNQGKDRQQLFTQVRRAKDSF